MRLRDKNFRDRPREKIRRNGVESLSDFELLQALVGSGNKQTDVSMIARRALKLFQLKGADVTYDELDSILGLGAAKISEIMSALEFSRRYLLTSEKPVIDSPEKAVNELEEIRNKKQEYFVCLTLDGANRLIAKRTVTIGTLTSSLVHPREVFADAVTDRAASIIVAHNHPSENLIPSKADLSVTKRLQDSAQTLGIKLQDHLIITKTSHASIVK